MTKYSKLISMFTICMLTVVGFVIYQAQAETAGPKVELVTLEGQEDELDPLQFLGHAYDYSTYSYNSTSFKFIDGDINYMEDDSLIERIDFTFSTGINRYIEDYRSFMRGKARQSTLFTETDDYLLYTGMPSDVNWQSFNDNTLTISLLNKETQEETAHEVLLNGGAYHNVLATYINYPQLTIATQSADDNMDSNWLIYSFDLDDPKEELTPVHNLGRTSEANTIHFSESKTKTGRFILFRTAEPGVTDEYDYVMDMIPTGYYVYDTQTEVVKEISSSEEGDTIILTESDTVLVGNDLGDTIEWSNWDFEEDSLTPLGESDMISQTIGRVPVQYYDVTFNQGLQLINGRIYAFEQETTEEAMTRPLFQVIELDSLETVFSGYFNVTSVPDTSQMDIEMFDYTFDHLSH